MVKCGIASNNGTGILTKLHLVFNALFKIDIAQLFTYYDFISVTATSPAGNTLIHLTNNEVTVNGSAPFVNSYNLACVMIGDLNGVTVRPALFKDQSQVTCPLTPTVFENN